MYILCQQFCSGCSGCNIYPQALPARGWEGRSNDDYCGRGRAKHHGTPDRVTWRETTLSASRTCSILTQGTVNKVCTGNNLSATNDPRTCDPRTRSILTQGTGGGTATQHVLGEEKVASYTHQLQGRVCHLVTDNVN